MSQSLIAVLACLGGIVCALVDGSRSVRWAAVVAGLALAPAAGSVGGTPAELGPLLMGLLCGAGATVAQLAAERLPAVPGMDPRVPVLAPGQGLFGPRSIRLFGVVLALPGASWMSLNVTVGGAAVASGAVFATAFVWLAGGLRLLRARALDELATGTVVIALASATGWLLQAGPGSAPEATTIAAVAVLAAVSAGWMAGRHRRPARPAGDAAAAA